MKPQRFGSIWDAIAKTRTEASNMKARAELMVSIEQVILSWQVTQVRAARRLKLTQPRLNDLLRGRIKKFSLDTLINIAARAGLTVEIRVAREAA